MTKVNGSDFSRGQFQGMVVTKLESIEATLKEFKIYAKNNHKRIESLEKDRAKMVGIAGFLGFIAGFLKDFIFKGK